MQNDLKHRPQTKNEAKSPNIGQSNKNKVKASKKGLRHRKWGQVIENGDKNIFFGPDAECMI